MSSMSRPCAWDQTEVVLKASVEPRDQPLASEWVQAYTAAFPSCFPRLHVLADSIGDDAPMINATFGSIPNSTLHALEYPPQMRAAGLGTTGRRQPLIHRLPAVYYAIQWPFMWADNFTTAAHVMVLDTDTWPMVPLRCHHLFDDDERPRWHTWEWPSSPGWIEHVNAIVPATARSRRDFMTFFPVVIPRDLLAEAREAVARKYGTHFDDAWLRIPNPSYGDLLGKVGLGTRPGALRVVHCPAIGKINQKIPHSLLQDVGSNECIDKVQVVEHLKHPHRDCHTGSCHHLSRSSALNYGRALRQAAALFTVGNAPMPPQLFHYQLANRSAAELQRIGADVLRDDVPGRVCGVRPDGRDEQQQRQASAQLDDQTGAAPSLELLLYDNHHQQGRPPKPTDLLYRSAAALGVPYRVGSLVPATERPWRSGDREEWLLRTLPTMKAEVVVLLDASDAVLYCRTAELLRKWRRIAGSSGGGRERILIGAEVQLWPEDHRVHVKTQGWPRSRRVEYPKPPMGVRPGLLSPTRPPLPGTPFRHINIGLMAGRPTGVLALLRCMVARFPGFPQQCPNERLANGSYQFVSNAPHATRFGLLHGHWGWEQSCFHTYLHEQSLGLLPPECPELALDYGAEVVLNLVKSTPALIMPWRAPQRPRLNETMLPSLGSVRPCVLHANSATKSILPVLWMHWDRLQAGAAGGGPPPVEADLWPKYDAYQQVAPCNQKIPPGGMRKPAVCPDAKTFLKRLTEHERQHP